MDMIGKLIQILKPERLYANAWYFKFKDDDME